MNNLGWKHKRGGATPSQKEKVGKVMREFKEGELHSGKSEKIVKDPKQAIAIALSEAGLSKKAEGGGVYEGISSKDKFVVDQLLHVISLKSISEKKNTIKNSILPNIEDYNLDEMTKKITKDNLQYALRQKNVSSLNKVLNTSINALKSNEMAKGGSTEFGMLSVKAGIDNNPNPTYADKIAGSKMKEMARGGHVSKGEMVWSKISDSKKAEFLNENFTPEITPRSQEKLVGKAWNFLPRNVKIKFEAKYANVEDYAHGGSVGKFEYKTIDISTEKGLKDAERLQMEGWKIISSGFNTIQFERPKSRMERGGSTNVDTYFAEGKFSDGSSFFMEEKDLEELKEYVDSMGSEINKNSITYFVRYNNGDEEKVKYANGGDLNGNFYILLNDGSKKWYSQSDITKIPNVYFGSGFQDSNDKGVAYVHYDNALRFVYKANGQRANKMVQYAGMEGREIKADGGNLDLNEMDIPVIRTQFEEEEFEFEDGGALYKRTKKTPDGTIVGKVVYNDFWKTYQVDIDGVVYEEFKTKEEAINNLKSAGFDKMAKGGNITQENREMLLSQVKEIKHHAEEISSKISRGSQIEAWVVAKMERASTDLSDVTHYLDGRTKMAKGGGVGNEVDFTVSENEDNVVIIPLTMKGAEYFANKLMRSKYEVYRKEISVDYYSIGDILEEAEMDGLKFSKKLANGGGVGFRNIDKIKSNIGEVIFNHITSLTKPQLEKQLSELKSELKIADKNSQRYMKLKDEEWYILYRLERVDEFQYAQGGTTDLNDMDIPVIRTQFEEEEFEFEKGGEVSPEERNESLKNYPKLKF